MLWILFSNWLNLRRVLMTVTKSKSEEESGDPGRTPGSAEGDRETIEEDLKEKHLDGNSEESEKDGTETKSSRN